MSASVHTEQFRTILSPPKSILAASMHPLGGQGGGQVPRAWISRINPRRDGRAASAIDWIFDGDEGVFAFVNICETLGIDGERLRSRVRERSDAIAGAAPDPFPLLCDNF